MSNGGCGASQLFIEVWLLKKKKPQMDTDAVVSDAESIFTDFRKRGFRFRDFICVNLC